MFAAVSFVTTIENHGVYKNGKIKIPAFSKLFFLSSFVNLYTHINVRVYIHTQTRLQQTHYSTRSFYLLDTTSERAKLKLNEKIFFIHFLFFPNFLEILVKFPDFLQTSWPTFKNPDFFQTFQTYRHHENVGKRYWMGKNIGLHRFFIGPFLKYRLL